MSLAFGFPYKTFARSTYHLPQVRHICSRHVISSSQSAPKRIVFLGTPRIAAHVLKRLHQASSSSDPKYELSAVVTQPPSPQGRKRIITKSPVHSLAEKLGLTPILTPVRASEEPFLQALSSIQPDLCITAAYGNFLPQKFLDVPKYGTLNIHPSLLPEFRGAAPVPRALEAGLQRTGVSILYTVLKMDAGPVVAVKERPLSGDEQTPELLKELVNSGVEVLLEILPKVWDRTLKMTEQDESQVTHAPKLSKEESRLSFTENAMLIHNKVRAFAGWPGTWADFVLGEGDNAEEIRLKIGKSVVLRKEGGVCLGIHNVDFDSDTQALVVTCGDGSRLGVLEVQPPGKRMMDAASFWNGLRERALQRKRVPY